MKLLFASLITLFFGYALYAQGSFLSIKSGGGFAGNATVYKVDKKGKVEKGNGLAQIAYTEEAQLKKSKARKWFRKTKSVLKSMGEFEHPGNVYYSLALIENDVERKITWGDKTFPISIHAENLYKEMTVVFNQLVFTPRPPKKK